jgi:WD40 repeat protein
LTIGTELVGDYVITKVLGAGGFGITYEANERSLDRTVAIKEYFPVDIVEREGWALVKARSTGLHIKYARGLRRFIEEAKAITQFNHPNIVRVLRYFKTNNTAFMVLHYEEGVDMGTWRENLKKPPTENQLAGIVTPLLDALELIHSNDFLHRDVAPDNIIIRKDGSPILIDFGSARSELTFNSKTVSALVKSGYSPFEQYAKNSKEQGPWTDIYSFGATLYQMVTGEAPPDSLSRLADDEMIPAIKRSKKYYSRDFLAAIDSSLAIKIADRPQSISEWRAMLFPAIAEKNNNIETNGKPQKSGLHASRSKQSTQPAVFLQRAGQTSVTGLMKKAGLKPAELGDNAARLAAKVKGPLLKLLPRSGEKAALSSNKQRPHVAPPHNEPPSPPLSAEIESNDDTASPRSLRSLLDELDDRYKDAGHEQVIEDAANRALVKNRRTASPTLAKAGKLFQSAGQSLQKGRRSLPFSLPFLAGLFFFGAIIWAINSYRSDLFDFTDKVELPQITAPPTDLPAKNNSALTKTVNAHEGGVTILRLSKDGRELISAGKDRVIKIWNMDSGTLFQSFKTHDYEITALDIKGQRLALADLEGSVFLFDLVNTELLTSFHALDGPVRSLAFIGKGSDLITGGDQGQLDYWELKDGQYSRRNIRGQGHEASINTILSHRRFFVTGSADSTTKIWGRSRRRLIRTYRGHKGPVSALALSPKAYRLATGSTDDTIKIWSPRARRIRRTLQAGQGGIESLAFAQNGKWLASGGADHSIKVWNARNGKLIRTYAGHGGAVRALVFSHNGKHIISGGDDGTIRFWDWSSRHTKK